MMSSMNFHQITATIARARQRLEDAETDEQRVIEEANISRLENLLAEPMNHNVIEDDFTN